MSQELKVDAVVKLGGSTLAEPILLAAAVEGIIASAHTHRLLVVPGGGVFAEAVRRLDRRYKLSDDTAHWMAVLAMDQSAYLVAEKLESGAVINEPGEVDSVHRAGQIPVLAPSRWLRQIDPLPHSWNVTSDSIAAWVAGRMGARRLVLIKPPGVGPTGVDAYFQKALPQGLSWAVVPADQASSLAERVAGSG